MKMATLVWTEIHTKESNPASPVAPNMMLSAPETQVVSVCCPCFVDETLFTDLIAEDVRDQAAESTCGIEDGNAK